MNPGSAMNNLIPLVTATPQQVEGVRVRVLNQTGKLPHPKSAYLIAVTGHILEEYKQFGKVTVRQVYYQLVSRGVIENSKRSYQNYVHLLTTGRKGGVIPWDAFEDRVRMFYPEAKPNYSIDEESSPEDALREWLQYILDRKFADYFGVCKWKDQEHHVELWIEKEALAGFL